MKRTSLYTVLTALILAAALLMSGCGSSSAIAAKVGDEEIKVSALENLYTGNSSTASYYGFDLTNASDVELFQDSMLDMLISNAVKEQKAVAAGITLTDEEETAAKDEAAKEYDEFWQEHVTAAENAGAADTNAYAQKLMTDTLVANGTTVKKLKASMLESAIANKLIEKHKDQLLAEAVLTDEEVETRYNQEVETQKTSFDANPTMYFTYETYYNYGYTYKPVYTPEGFFYVRHILVADEETAKEVLSKIDAGEDFETLLATYNTDPGMQNEAYAKGYVVGEGANFLEEFLAAALLLRKEGDVSPATKTTAGYHIIKRMGDVPSGATPFADAKEDYAAYAAAAYQSEYYNGLIDEWMAEDTVVRYPENYRFIGKSAVVEATAAPEATAEPTSVG